MHSQKPFLGRYDERLKPFNCNVYFRRRLSNRLRGASTFIYAPSKRYEIQIITLSITFTFLSNLGQPKFNPEANFAINVARYYVFASVFNSLFLLAVEFDAINVARRLSFNCNGRVEV